MAIIGFLLSLLFLCYLTVIWVIVVIAECMGFKSANGLVYFMLVCLLAYFWYLLFCYAPFSVSIS